MPLAINSATKALAELLVGGKEYIALMHVHKDFELDDLNKTLRQFTGVISQLPPVRSNVKRQYRDREIYYLDVLEIEGNDVLFKVGVQSGTYIRKLINDIGEKLGTGAHMIELRRSKVSTLSEKSGLVTLQDLDDAVYFYQNEKDDRLLKKCIQNIEDALDFMPKVIVSDEAVDTVAHGSPVAVPGIVKMNSFEKNDRVFISTLKGELIALGNAVMTPTEIMHAKGGIAIKNDSVIMRTGTYPVYKKIN